MKIPFICILCFICTTSVFAQTNHTLTKGNYFKTTREEYFKKVFQPWRYQYTQTKTDQASGALNKTGEIIFWRSEAIYDDVSRNYWKPNINFDIYPDTDSTFIKNLAAGIKSLSTCDTINRGGDIFFIGHFILVNSSSCVNCASSSNIDYCRNIIKRIIDSVSDKNTYDWNLILSQFIIVKGKFKS